MTDPLPSLPSGLHFIVRQIQLATRKFIARIELAAIAVNEITSIINIHRKTSITIMRQAVIGRKGPSRHLLRAACTARNVVAAAGRSLAVEALDRGARFFAHAFQDAPGFGVNANRCVRDASCLA